MVKIPVAIRINKEWSAKDFTSGPQNVALRLQGALSGTATLKMIAIPNGKFSVNTERGREKLNADNVSLPFHAIDWLPNDNGLIEIRKKCVICRPLDSVDDTFRELLNVWNVFLPVFLWSAELEDTWIQTKEENCLKACTKIKFFHFTYNGPNWYSVF